MKQLKYTQHGLSMIELLVSLAISGFLILGITQVYLDNKRNYIFQQSQGNNLENARFAELTINTLLGKAGYRRALWQSVSDPFPKINKSDECNGFMLGAAITGMSDESNGFCMRYQPASSSETDCQGYAVKTINGTDMDEPFIKPDHRDETVILAIKFVPDSDLHRGSLQCKNLSGRDPEFVELVSGVADMRFEFGVGSKDLLDRGLKDSDAWEKNPSATEYVRAVRYSILLASGPNQRDGDSKIFTNWVAETKEDINKKRLTKGDRRNIYQQSGSTQTLRNMMP